MDSFFEFYETLAPDFWWIESRNDLIDKLFPKFIFNKDLRILDIGCGTGLNYKSLKAYGEVCNLDYSEKAVQYCKGKKVRNLLRGDAKRLPFCSSTFGLVTAIELIEHIDEDFLVISEIYRILRKGGIALITVPAFKFLWSYDDITSGHKRRYTLRTIHKLLERTGFQILLSNHRYFFIFIPTFILFKFQYIFKKGQNSLQYTPNFLNNFLRKISKLENYLIFKGVKFHAGVGIVCIVKK